MNLSALNRIGVSAGLGVSALLLAVCGVLGGCSASFDPVLAPGAASPGASLGAIKGRVHGGQQAVVGAAVYVLQSGTTAYGAASTSLLTSAVLTDYPANSGKDASGNYYVTTKADGSFSLGSDYSCTAGGQVYLYAVGGNPGAGVNSAAGFLAVLGQCPTGGGTLAATVPFVWMNEVTTVAAAYAFAGFAVDALHVASDAGAVGNTTASQATAGIANAFANAANLVNVGTGTALVTTPSGTGTAPQATVNTLANILAACVNSSGPGSGACSTLLGNAESAGASGTMPTDTATAAINMAHYPGTNVAALYGLQSGLASPFAPSLSAVPGSLQLVLMFTGGGLNATHTLAIDSQGNVWSTNNGAIVNYSSTYATLMTPSGSFVTGSSGHFLATISTPNDIAIDLNDNVWIPTSAGGYTYELSSSAANVGGSPYLINEVGPSHVVVDASNNVWFNSQNTGSFGIGFYELPSGGTTTNRVYAYGNILTMAFNGTGDLWSVYPNGNYYLAEYNPATQATLNSGSFTTSIGPIPVSAVDALGQVWIGGTSGLYAYSSTGVVFPNAPFSTILVSGVAVDGSSNIWSTAQCLAFNEYSSSGVQLSPTGGYSLGGTFCNDKLAVDGSGNLWIANLNTTSLMAEVVGGATPVVTPIVAGVKYNKLGARP